MESREGGPRGDPNENKESNKDAKTLYDVLGVKNDAPEWVIQSAFRAQSVHCHSDKFREIAKERGINLETAGDEEKFKKQLNEEFKILKDAYDVLSNPDKRAKYDQLLKEKRQRQEEEAKRMAQKETPRSGQYEQKQRQQERAEQKGEQAKTDEEQWGGWSYEKQEEDDEKEVRQRDKRKEKEAEEKQQKEKAQEEAERKKNPEKIIKVEQRGDIWIGVRNDNGEVLMDAKKEKVISKAFNKIIFGNDGLIKGKENMAGRDFLHLIHPVTGRLITGKGKHDIIGFEKISIEEIEVKTGIFKKRKSEENETEKVIMGISYRNKKDVELYKLADYREDMANYREGK